ncbi:MAG: precorrin-6Y C5,15-methyltransferase (decarboxylating) subunit CbiT [Candidatus Hydrothermarchaeales archaeon]
MEHSLGIPDEEFIGGAPMTKQEVRAVTLSKARIGDFDIIYDIGAGCGSLTVEAALLARGGRVFAVERNADRIPIIEKNLKIFGVKNVDIINREAPDVLAELPLADRIIIGGSGGKIGGILRKSIERLKRGGIIVVNIVTLDSLGKALSTLQALDLDFNVTQVSISRSETVGDKMIMKAHNPVFVIDVRR